MSTSFRTWFGTIVAGFICCVFFTQQTYAFQEIHLFEKSPTTKLLVTNTCAEARGEGRLGQVATTYVVLKRVKNPRFPNSISGVITAKSKSGNYEFEWYAQRKHIEERLKNKCAVAEEVVRDVLYKRVSDPFPQAYFYLNPYKTIQRHKKLPHFACDATFLGKVDNHFYFGLLPWDQFKKKCIGKPKPKILKAMYAKNG